MEWPISQSEAARRAGVTSSVASILIRSHKVPTEKLPGASKYIGLMPEAFEQFERLAKPFRRKRKAQPQVQA